MICSIQLKPGVKNARLELATSPEKDIELLLEFAERRVDEMLTLAEEGKRDFRTTDDSAPGPSGICCTTL